MGDRLYVSIFPSYSGFKDESEQNCTTDHSLSPIRFIQSIVFKVSRSILSSIGGSIYFREAATLNTFRQACVVCEEI